MVFLFSSLEHGFILNFVVIVAFIFECPYSPSLSLWSVKCMLPFVCAGLQVMWRGFKTTWSRT